MASPVVIDVGNVDNAIRPSVSINRVTASTTLTAADKLEKHYPRFTEWVEWWFNTGEKDERSPLQLEREKYVLWAPWTGDFQRWMIVLPSCVVQLCLGSVSCGQTSVIRASTQPHLRLSPVIHVVHL